MSDQTDFIVLYRELGIDPDCSVDDLRLAYRRRVADLHPDRAGASGEDALKSLNLRYAAALDFHRHYDRLPGAAPVSVPRDQPAHAVPPQPPGPEAAPSVEPVEPEARRPSKVVVYGIMLAAALLMWWLSNNGTGSPWFHGGGIAMNEREQPSSSAMALRPGMSQQGVLDLLGEPVSRESGGALWVYGPSWVRFHCAAVVDWYSSPMRPLRASRSGPPGGAEPVAGRCP